MYGCNLIPASIAPQRFARRERARSDRRAASAGAVLGDVRGDAERAARGYELARVRVFVPTSVPRMPLFHRVTALAVL